MNIEPIAGKIVLKKLSQDRTSGGVIMPDIAQEGSQEAEVIAIGPPITTQLGKELPIQTSIGDKVLYPKFGAKSIDIDGEEYLIINEAEVFLIFKGENK
jgi:chaperonin GroES|tara:strand:+ start:917 stop:1213 length:297 start_codon:yes stop_codon:yes gene_type:complete